MMNRFKNLSNYTLCKVGCNGSTRNGVHFVHQRLDPLVGAIFSRNTFWDKVMPRYFALILQFGRRLQDSGCSCLYTLSDFKC
jgi:hypothetical protein